LVAESNEIGVLVQFRADLGNLNSALGAAKTQLNQLTLGSAKLSQLTGQSIPELSQQVAVLKALGAQGDATAKSMVNLAQGTKTFYSVYSGNVKQNLAAMFRSNLATKQTVGELGKELQNVQVISQKTGQQMGTFANNWALKTRTMANVYVESLHRHAVAWVSAGKQLQWVGRQMIVGITAPLAALGYVLGKAATDISRAETQLAIFLQTGNRTVEQTAELVTKKLSPALRQVSEQLGITWEETDQMAASWAAAGYSAEQLLVPVTRLTEELATLAQGDIDVSQAQELIRNINATYYDQTAKGIEKTKQQIQALQVIQSTTALQMKDIVESLPIVTQIGKELDLNATQLTAMIAGMRQYGVEANIGATALRNSLAQLANPSKEASDLFLKRFGTTVSSVLYDSKGQPRGVSAIEDLAKMFDTLNSAQKNELATSLFGTRQFARMYALFDAIQNKQSKNKQSDYNSAINDTTDPTKNAEFWQKQLDSVLASLAKQWDIIKVKLGNAVASLGQTLIPQIQNLAESFVGLVQGIDDLLKRFPQLASWFVKIATAAAALGPAVYVLGQFKLLTGTIGTGLTGLGRNIFKISSQEAPNLLEQAIAANPGNIALATAGGLKSPALTSALAGPGDLQTAVSVLGQSIAGNEGRYYTGRQIPAQMLAALQVGGGQVGQMDFGAIVKELSGHEGMLAKAATGAALTPDEAYKLSGVMEKILGEQLVQISGDSLDEIGKSYKTEIQRLIARGELTSFVGAGGRTGYRGKTGSAFLNAAGLKAYVARELGAAEVAKTLNVPIMENAGAATAAQIAALQSGKAGVATSIQKTAIAGDQTGWVYRLFGAKSATSATQDAAKAGEKTAKSFLTSVKETFQAGGRKGLGILQLFEDKKVTALTASEKGFTAIAMRFTSILPELILLIGVAVLVMKNWKKIWEGLEPAMNTVGNIIAEIGEIWKSAFDNIFSSQNKGDGMSEFWVEFGKTLGDVAIMTADLAKIISSLLAPVIASIAKLILEAVQALILLFSALSLNAGAMDQFISGGTSVLAKIIAITTAVFLFINVLLRVRQAILALSAIRGVADAVTGLKMALSALGTVGVVAIVAAIATAFMLLTKRANEAKAAANAYADSLVSLGKTTSELIANAKQGMSFDSTSFFSSITESLSKLHESNNLTDHWADRVENVKGAYEGLVPVLQQLVNLNDKQLNSLQEQLKTTIHQLEIEQQIAEAQLISAINQESGTSYTMNDLPGILAGFAKVEHDTFLGQSTGSIKEPFKELYDTITSNAFVIDVLKSKMNSFINLMKRSNVDGSVTLEGLQGQLLAAQQKVGDLGTAARQTAKDLKDAFNSAYESQLAQTTDRVTSSILDAFDKQTQAMTDAIDKRIELIQKQNDKEEWLQQQREFRLQREKMMYDNEVSMATAAAERQKAINEGRYDDARIIELQALQNQSDYQSQMRDLETNHDKAVKDHAQQQKIDELNKQKDHLLKVRDIMRTRLTNILSEITEFGARTKKEWLSMYSKMNGIADDYGVKIQNTAHSFFQSWGHTINRDLQDAFHDAQVAASREAEKTGKAVVDGFQEGLSQSEGLKLLDKAGAILDKITKYSNDWAKESSRYFHGKAHGGDLYSSSRYLELVSQFTQIIKQISGPEKKHSGGMIDGGRTGGEVPIIAQQGEYVIRRSAVKKIGISNLNKLNEPSRYHDGGIVSGTKTILGGLSLGATQSLGGNMSGIMNVAGAFLKNIFESLMRRAGEGLVASLPIDGMMGALSYYKGRAIPGKSGRNGATPGMTTLYDWIMSKTSGIGGSLGVGHAYTGTTGYSQHAYGNAVDFFGQPTAMMKSFLTIVKNATGALKGLLGHVIHAGKKWSWNSGFGNYTPPSGTNDLHYGHIHADALPEYGGTPPGYPMPSSQWYMKGGLVRANGGKVHAGEYVFPSDAVRRIGIKTLDKLSVPKLNANDIRFSMPAFMQANAAAGGMGGIAGHSTINEGDVIIKVDIEKFFGDDNSYRELYQTLERVGSQISRQRGNGSSTIFRGNI